MQRPPRFIPANGLVEVTIRTIQGRLLLTPNSVVNDTILGILGRAQQREQMVIHYAVFLSNHAHLLLSPRDAKQLARFMCFANSNIAREIGRLVDWGEKFWSRRYQAIPVTNEPRAQLGRLRYALSQGLKENLVEHPFDWPGVNTARALAEGEVLSGTWFDRTGFWHATQKRKKSDPPVQAADFKEVYTLEITPLPCLASTSIEQRQQAVRDLIAELVQETTTARLGGAVLGAHSVRNQHPHSVPNVSHSPAPRVHAASKKSRSAFYQQFAEFVAAYREAVTNLKFGLPAHFPAGCFPPPLPFVEANAA